MQLDADDLFVNQKGGVFETKLASDFDASGTGGEDLFRNEQGGTVLAATDPNTKEHSSFVNLERFENAGLITMQDGQVGDQFEISNTVGERDLAFVASPGSTLAVDQCRRAHRYRLSLRIVRSRRVHRASRHDLGRLGRYRRLQPRRQQISFDDDPNVRGRFGLRVGTSTQVWTGITAEPFVIGALWGNLSGDNQATLTSTGTNFILKDNLDDVWGEVSAGVNFFNPSANTSVFAKLDVTFGEDVDGVGGKAGMRVSW